MSRSIRSYQREIRKLRNLLKSVEWVMPTYNGSPSCSCCGNQQHWGHKTDCELDIFMTTHDIRWGHE